MKQKVQKFPFVGTKEQENELMEVINHYKTRDVALMPILQRAQSIYGYLPVEVQEMVSEGINTPLEEIYGVVTFYSQFNLEPMGDYEIAVCMGTACYVKGAGGVLDKFSELLGIKPEQTSQDRRFTLTASRCIGACGLAPVITVNGEVYGKLKVSDVDDIVKKYMDKGEKNEDIN